MAGNAEEQAVGYGFGEEEGHCVDVNGVEREGVKTVTEVPESDTADLGEKRGTDSCAEADNCDAQVAKKQKVENGGGGGVLEELGLDEAAVEEPETVGRNGADKHEEKSDEKSDEGSEELDLENGAAEDTEEPASEKSKDGQGEVGLRTLLQEGDTKSTILNHDLGDATHMLNGAK